MHATVTDSPVIITPQAALKNDTVKGTLHICHKNAHNLINNLQGCMNDFRKQINFKALGQKDHCYQLSPML